jgi:hypothetical protein
MPWSDDDIVDVDLMEGASMNDVITAGGDLAYDPGDDLDMSGALSGEGNDMASLNFLNANLEDNDILENATVSNNADF